MLRTLLKEMTARGTATRDRDEAVARDSALQARWIDGLVLRLFHLMHTFEQDNFDSERYRNVPANAFFAERHAAYYLYLLNNVERFFRSRQLLADEPSRALYDELILFRILGHLHVRLPFNTPENQMHLATAESWRVEDTDDVGPFGPLSIFVVPGKERDIRVKGWKANVTWTFLYRQYYFERDGVAVKPETGDYVIDAGGCFGDTALGFADVVGSRGHVYVFDPLPKHCAIMQDQLALNPELGARISIFAAGLADQVNDVAPLADDGVIDPGARLVAASVPTTTIDEVVAREDLPRVDFIKMDIEGSELSALGGAEATLHRWRPKLAISLYHRPEDFFAIPLWIDQLGCGYRLYLDHYSIHHEETVLYASV
jgi:FkbM family methyltransferase